MNIKKQKDFFFENVAPTKLTETWRVKLQTEGWGLLSNYILESVKIDRQRSGTVSSIATLRVTDKAGQVTCLIRGSSIGLLFGLTPKEWASVENLCLNGQQLFYRYFKNGINKDFSFEQKLMYNFCATCQKHDILVVRFRRSVNTRQKFNQDVFLDISEVKLCDDHLLDLYVQYLNLNIT